MKVYIAGSISENEYYKQEFEEAEKALKEQGHTVYNPAKNSGDTYRDYMNIGLYQLMHCEAIYLLKGYEFSKGAMLEKHYAETVGMEIMYEE